MGFVACDEHRSSSFSQSLDLVILFAFGIFHCLKFLSLVTKLFSVCVTSLPIWKGRQTLQYIVIMTLKEKHFL